MEVGERGVLIGEKSSGIHSRKKYSRTPFYMRIFQYFSTTNPNIDARVFNIILYGRCYLTFRTVVQKIFNSNSTQHTYTRARAHDSAHLICLLGEH